MMTTDLALIGRLGDAALAAAALAHTVLFAAFTIGMGLVSAVAPLAAQAYGAREPRMVRRALRVGLWTAFVLGVPVTLVQFRGEHILIALGQVPEAAALAGRYLSGMAWAIIPAWTFIALRNFMGAVNRPGMAAVDHARRHPDQRCPGLCPDIWRVRPARARPHGRRSGHRAGRCRHVHRGNRNRLHAAPLQEVSRARTLLASRLAAAHQADRHRPPDLGRLAAGVRAVCGSGTADGPHRHGGGGRPSDRAAGRGDALHGALRHSDGRHGAGGAGGGPARCRRHAPSGLRGADAGRRLHGGHDAHRGDDAACHPLPLPWGRGAPVGGDGGAGRDLAGVGCQLLHDRRRADGGRRRAAGSQRHARAAAVLGVQLLGDRFREQPVARLLGWPRRRRRVDRPLARHRRLCRPAGVALPCAYGAQLLPAVPAPG